MKIATAARPAGFRDRERPKQWPADEGHMTRPYASASAETGH